MRVLKLIHETAMALYATALRTILAGILKKGRLLLASNREIESLRHSRALWPNQETGRRISTEIRSPDGKTLLIARSSQWPPYELIEIRDARTQSVLARHLYRQLVVIGWARDYRSVYLQDIDQGLFTNAMGNVKRLEP